MSSQTIQQYFKLLQDPTRRSILETIEDRSYSFSEIRDKLDFSAEKSSKLAYHLQQLEEMGLIEKNENDRYELTGFCVKLMIDVSSLESTIKTGMTVGKWIRDLIEEHPSPPIYVTEIHGNISIKGEKFDGNMLVSRITDMINEVGLDFDYSRYMEKDESGATREGWVIKFPTGFRLEKEEMTQSAIIIFVDGSFNVEVRYSDDLRVFPFYDYERHNKYLKEGKCKVPFFFVQAMTYNYLYALYVSAHSLWGKNLKLTLKQPKNLYVWVPAKAYETHKAQEVKIPPLWIEELQELSWKEPDERENSPGT